MWNGFCFLLPPGSASACQCLSASAEVRFMDWLCGTASGHAVGAEMAAVAMVA